MKRLVTLMGVVILALLMAAGVWITLDNLGRIIESGTFPAMGTKEVIPVERSCVDDMQQYNSEVEARINAAILLERAKHQVVEDEMEDTINKAVLEERGRWVRQIEVAIGSMKIFEDGVYQTPTGEYGCIPYTLCDSEKEMLWNPQDLFWPPE